MKDRIYQIMEQENMNQKEFSETTGIATATLSSIFNGRTSPTLKHAQALHKRFPRLSMNWLMFGEGDMYETDVPASAQDAPDSASGLDDEGVAFIAPELMDSATGLATVSHPSILGSTDRTRNTASESQPVVRETVKYIDKPQRKISEIRIFYDDGTYEVFPAHV